MYVYLWIALFLPTVALIIVDRYAYLGMLEPFVHYYVGLYFVLGLTRMLVTVLFFHVASIPLIMFTPIYNLAFGILGIIFPGLLDRVKD